MPTTYSPAMEMRMRVLDFGTDKYGLNAWIFDGTNDGTTNYDKVLFSKTKSATDSVGILAKGQWADVKVTIQGGALNGLTAGMLIRVEELTGNLSRVRLFHTSVSRALATWPGFSEAGFTGDFAEYLAQKFPTSTAADFAVLEAGVVSEETYIEQGCTGRPPTSRCSSTSPTNTGRICFSSGCRQLTSSSTSSSASSRRRCPAVTRTPPTTTSISMASRTVAWLFARPSSGRRTRSRMTR